jgi:drug/metabolite transporter (DMT)-like permease
MSVPPSPLPAPPPPVPADGSSGNRFSLATLFVFMTLAAVLLAAISALLRGALDDDIYPRSQDAIGWMVAGLFLGAVMGLVLGLQQFRRGRAAAIGLLAGGVLGLLMGWLATCSAQDVLVVTVILSFGSLLVVGVAFVLRPRG